MMKHLNKQYWGWGLRVDQNGNLHDPFPIAHPDHERAQREKTPRRVKPVGRRLKPAEV
ncbi:MAG: hypothetical protein RSA65_08520 [Clostridia bacterium]